MLIDGRRREWRWYLDWWAANRNVLPASGGLATKRTTHYGPGWPRNKRTY